MNQLTKQVILCQKKEEDFEPIYNEILIIAYQYPVNCLKWEEDICAEFLLSFEPKIKKLVFGFTYRNIEFSTYLNNTLNWHGRTIQKQKRVNSFYKNVTLNEYIAESPLEIYCERENSYNNLSQNDNAIGSIIDLLETITPGKRISNTQAFIIFLFSRCQNIDDQVLQYLSQFLAIDSEYLFTRLVLLREGLEKRRRRWNHYNERINTLHCTIEVIKMSLEGDLKEATRYNLEIKLQIKINLLNNAQENLSKLSLTPSVSMLAEIFEIPRGSIFTSISRVRKSLESLYQNPQFIYPSEYEDKRTGTEQRIY